MQFSDNNFEPIITVIMPVYNAAPYVAEAVHSVLNQTFRNFEFIIFNDGSTDESSFIINGIKDERIIFYDDKHNTGYVDRLNKGLEIARGKYIARMDSDDICLPDRFAKQLEFMEANSKIGVCGTAFQTFGSSNIIPKTPVDDASIREYMLEYNPIGHPTVMMRKSVLDEHKLKYSKEAMPAEDYLMWYTIGKYSLLGNLPDILLKYRVHEHQISSVMNVVQRNIVDKIRWIQLYEKGFVLNESEVSTYHALLNADFSNISNQDIYKFFKLLNNLFKQNKDIGAFPQEWLVRLLGWRWRIIVSKITKFNINYVYYFMLTPKPIDRDLSMTDKLKLLAKSMIFWKV